MREHLLVEEGLDAFRFLFELTEHDKSAVDIMVQSTYIYVLLRS